MGHISVVMVAAVVAWGPVERSPAPAPPTTPPPASVAPVAPIAPLAPVAPTGAPPVSPAIIVRGPIDARATPLVAVAPATPPRERRPLYQRWQFWAIAGGLLATAIVVTVAASRPRPQPYTGNAPPFSIGLP